MIYSFDTKQKHVALAALLVYAVYRSRDFKRFKVSTEMWGQIERFVKSSAKRAKTLAEFMDKLMPRLCCSSISPKWMKIGSRGAPVAFQNGCFAAFGTSEDAREFFTDIFESEEAADALRSLYNETTFIILIVRDRLEREKPIEKTLQQTPEFDEGEEL